ncbi:MAG TPA: bifunctional phosphoglucose/phosphomannose isomerase [Solirubrobacterales bacterium]|nr:bifunctional phosphoglucose/phosphomannose isomerase [Solirubrobacterales bacterium]
MPGLTREQIEQVDTARQVEDVLAMPKHLGDALWRVESAGLDSLFAQIDGIEHLIVAGMGGSAIGADLARAALGDRLTKPMTTARGYQLPQWVTPSSVVLCASYSGNTEETLACYDAARALGSMRIVVTTGGRLAECAREDGVPVIPLPAGLQPRAAVGYMTVAALEVATLAGVAQGVRTEVDAAAAGLTRLAEEWGPDADTDSLAKRVAQRINGTCVCVYGAVPTAAVATRWKTQLNENAKLPAFAAELPEADHNEIVGWHDAASLCAFTAVFLEDVDQHPRVRQRVELTAALIEQQAAGALRLESVGSNPLERLLSLVLLGDLVSVYLAVLRDIDPTPVEQIDRLKAALARAEVT